MSIQRLLKEDYARTRTGDPARTGAYDRFLRRRARYARRVVAAASVALAAALALAVAVPRVLDRGEVVGPPKGQVLERPAFGYDLVVPPGWRVAGEGSWGLQLEPVPATTSSTTAAATTTTLPPTTTPRVPGATTPRPADTAGAPRPSATIAITAVVVDPSDYPGLQPGEAAVRLPEGPQLNGGPQPERLEGRREPGRRADGRAFLHVESSPMVSGGETYYLAWPYYCAAGVRCPASLRYRALRVTGGVWSRDGSGLPTLRDAMRRIVDTVRPVTNALPGGATDRPACQLSPPTDPASERLGLFRLRPVEASPSVGVSSMTEGGPRGTSDFFMNFSSGLAMCHLEKRFTVEFWKSGRRVPVQGDETVATLAGDLPEGDGEFPSLSKAWLWRNWCGHPNSSVTIRFRGLDGLELDAPSAMRPPCVDQAKPSTLQETTLPIRVP